MAKTGFAFREIEIEGYKFWIDGNSKVTANNGTFENPAANAFSLPHLITCPDKTRRCAKACYVNELKEYSPATYSKFQINHQTIQAVLALPQAQCERIAINFAIWINHNLKRFRWHNSGDIFSVKYAYWIRMVGVHLTVPSWIYTRSFWAVTILAGIDKLTVNLSADAENFEKALAVHDATGCRICYMAQEERVGDLSLPAGSVIFPDYPNRGRQLSDPTTHSWWINLPKAKRSMVCSADFFGQSEKCRCGPCKKCF